MGYDGGRLVKSDVKLMEIIRFLVKFKEIKLDIYRRWILIILIFRLLYYVYVYVLVDKLYIKSRGVEENDYSIIELFFDKVWWIRMRFYR